MPPAFNKLTVPSSGLIVRVVFRNLQGELLGVRDYTLVGYSEGGDIFVINPLTAKADLLSDVIAGFGGTFPGAASQSDAIQLTEGQVIVTVEIH